MNKKYHYFYKITNLINEHYYYGIHSTNNLNDGYMGSGIRLHKAYKKYGIENFTKEILKFFDTRKEASDYEVEMVTETLVKNENCYNSVAGGVICDKYKKIIVFSIKENIWQLIDADYYREHKNEYRTTTEGYAIVFIDGKYRLIDSKKFKELKAQGIKLQTPTSNRVTLKDKKGNFYSVSLNDERYLSGELVPVWKDRKHSKETKEKMREAHILSGHQQGEKNSQYGTCWVYNKETNENISIKREELQEYLNNGYIKGRKLKMPNDKISLLNKEEIIKMRKENKKWIEIYTLLGISESTMRKFRKIHKDIK